MKYDTNAKLISNFFIGGLDRYTKTYRLDYIDFEGDKHHIENVQEDVITMLLEHSNYSKPKIPLYVGDYIVEQKMMQSTLSEAIDNLEHDRVGNWYYEHSEEFARAWLVGFDIFKVRYFLAANRSYLSKWDGSIAEIVSEEEGVNGALVPPMLFETEEAAKDVAAKLELLGLSLTVKVVV